MEGSDHFKLVGGYKQSGGARNR